MGEKVGGIFCIGELAALFLYTIILDTTSRLGVDTRFETF